MSKAIHNFMTKFVDAVIDGGKYINYINDIRNCTPSVGDTSVLYTDSKGADDTVMAMVLRDRHYDVGTGYTMQCIDYSDITDNPDVPDDASDYYWIKVIARHYRRGSPHASLEMCVDTPNGRYSQEYIELDVHICLDYEYGLDEHWSGGKTVSYIRGCWSKRIVVKSGRAPRHNIERLAEEALKGFGNAP